MSGIAKVGKVALIHDWLTGMRGGERCLLHFLRLFPDADLFSFFHVVGSTDAEIDRRLSGCSRFNRLPGVRRYYRALLPLYPSAARQIDLREYDLVISLSHAAAKNVAVAPHARHISYCFTPMRYIWDQATSYFGPMTPALWPLIGLLRSWDRRGAERVDDFVAISRFVSARIRCFYGRRSAVIYPPVDTSWITPAKRGEQGEAFLYAGALVPYKEPEVVIDAFNRLGEPLWIVGQGPMEKALRRRAKSNVRFFGRVSDSELAELYRRSRALIFPGVEDFGLIPVEVLAAGRPVIGRLAGGLRESVRGLKPHDYSISANSLLAADRLSGVFFDGTRAAAVDRLCAAVDRFRQIEGEIEPSACIEQAQQFSPRVFYRSWGELMLRLGIECAVPAIGEADECAAILPRANREAGYA